MKEMKVVLLMMAVATVSACASLDVHTDAFAAFTAAQVDIGQSLAADSQSQ